MIYSKIIGKFNNCFPENIIYRRVFPIAINFCFDDISQVRFCSAKHNSKLILQLLSGKDEEYTKLTLIIIKSFAQSINYKYRQLFINMCTHLFENEKVFDKYISELLIDLAYDQVPNVKIILARFIHKILTKEKYKNLKDNITVKKIVKILKNDKNIEVIDFIGQIKDFNFDELNNIDVELDKKVNWKFKDNMTFVSKEFGITKNVPLTNIFKESKFGNESNSDENSGDKKEEKDKNEIIVDNKIEDKMEEHKKEDKKEEEQREEEANKEEIKKEEVNKVEEHKEEEKKEENKNEEKKEEENKIEENKEKSNSG